MSELVFSEKPDSGVPVHYLNSLFANTTNSYKYFLFLAILDWFDPVTNPDWKGFSDLQIPLEWLAERMLVHAWDPVVYFGLSLGSMDKLSDPLKTIRDRMTSDGKRFSVGVEQALPQYRTAELDKLMRAIINRYVPYRLIRPFYQSETRGLPDHKVNKAVADASVRDQKGSSFYVIEQGANHLAFRSTWAVFFVHNLGVLRQWAKGQLIGYLTSRNPLAPSVAKKLRREERQSLKYQREYVFWLIENGIVANRCMFSGQRLRRKQVALDHFLPRVLVAHDQIWNLFPVDRSVNSQKGAQIPSERYVELAADNQYRYATHLYSRNNPLSDSKRKEFEADIMAALQLNSEVSVVSFSEFSGAYRRAVLPWMSVAPSFGLSTGWEYQPREVL